MAEFILHNYFRSSTSFRARIALHLKGLDFEYRPINLLKGEHHSPEYRKINPMGGVPTLTHKNKNIPDSVAIIEYLEEVTPSPAFLPKDAYLRARVRQVNEIINSSLHPMGNLKTLNYLEKNSGYDQARKDQWIQHWSAENLKAVETILKEFAGTYCFGDSVTMTDIFLIPQIVTCQRFKVDLATYPTLMRIFETCLRQEAFAKAHPFRQIDTPDDLRIN